MVNLREKIFSKNTLIIGTVLLLTLTTATTLTNTAVLQEAEYQFDTKILGQEVTEGNNSINAIKIRDSYITSPNIFSTVQDSTIYPGDTITVCGEIYPESSTDGYHYTSFYLVSGGDFTPDHGESDSVTKRVEKNSWNTVCLDTEVPSQTGTYEVAVWTLYNDLSGDQLGAKDSFTVEEEPLEPADAEISVDSTTVAPNKEVVFDGSQSTGEGSLEYYWYRGNTEVSRGSSYSTSFSSTGTYTVNLEVYGDAGVGSLDSVDINVEVEKPDAVISVSSTNVSVGEPVTFDGSESVKGTYSISDYRWTVDGEVLTGESVTYTPVSEGVKTVELEVADSQGFVDSASKEFYVYSSSDDGSGSDGDGGTDTDGSGVFDSVRAAFLNLLGTLF